MQVFEAFSKTFYFEFGKFCFEDSLVENIGFTSANDEKYTGFIGAVQFKGLLEALNEDFCVFIF